MKKFVCEVCERERDYSELCIAVILGGRKVVCCSFCIDPDHLGQCEKCGLFYEKDPDLGEILSVFDGEKDETVCLSCLGDGWHQCDHCGCFYTAEVAFETDNNGLKQCQYCSQIFQDLAIMNFI